MNSKIINVINIPSTPIIMKIKSYIWIILKLLFSLILFIVLPVYYVLYINKIELITGWITLLAVITALFKDNLIQFYLPPKLEIKINNSPEYLHDAKASLGIVGGVEHTERQKWLGIKVVNEGIGKAKNVMVFFSGIGSNRIKNFNSFKTIPLRRSWIPETRINLLPAKVGIRFDILFIRQSLPRCINFSFYATPRELTDIDCPQKEDSRFTFKIIVISDNAKTVHKKISITYKGDYDDIFQIE